jgi:hypothetical protein
LVADHHRPHGEDMRADRRHHKDPAVRREHRPPALSEYAVEPVGVATIKPSALYSVSDSP